MTRIAECPECGSDEPIILADQYRIELSDKGARKTLIGHLCRCPFDQTLFTATRSGCKRVRGPRAEPVATNGRARPEDAPKAVPYAVAPSDTQKGWE